MPRKELQRKIAAHIRTIFNAPERSEGCDCIPVNRALAPKLRFGANGLAEPPTKPTERPTNPTNANL